MPIYNQDTKTVEQSTGTGIRVPSYYIENVASVDVSMESVFGFTSNPEDLNLEVENPDFSNMSTVRQLSRDLYTGFTADKEKKQNYLYQSVNEDNTQHETRAELAYYDNLLRLIIKMRQALLWRKVPQFVLPDYLEAYKDDVDGLGTNRLSFFQNITENAEVDGVAWVLIDKPAVAVEVTGTLSVAEEQALRIRPYMKFIPASAVIDWDFDPVTNELLYVTTKGEIKSPPRPGYKRTSIDQWKVWTKDTWTVYIKNPDRSSDQKYIIHSSGVHSAMQVPLVPFYGKKVKKAIGEPIGAQILDHCIAVFNKTSHIDSSIWRTLTPIPWIASEENPGDMSLVGGKAIHIPLSKNPNVKGSPSVGILEMQGNGLDIGRQERDSIVVRIYEFALSSVKRDSKLIESDKTLRQAETTQRSDLMAASINLEKSITDCYDIFEVLLGKPESDKTVSTNKDFDDATLEEGMLKEFREAVAAGLLSKEEYVHILQAGEIYKNPEFTLESELAKLKKAEDEADEKQRLMLEQVKADSDSEDEDDSNDTSDSEESESEGIKS